VKFRPVGPRVYVRRQRRLDLNVGLIVGDKRCLLIDTGETAAQAEAIRAAVCEVTDRPLTLVNTHGHHDHCFGNATFAGAEIWGHPGCGAMLAASAERQRAAAARAARQTGDTDLVAALGDVVVVPPNRLVRDVAHVDLGGVTAVLHHLGRGHTDHDVVVEVPGVALFVGDLVEQGAPPAFEDAWPLDWPATLARVADLAGQLGGDLAVVPGHGAVVDGGFVADQQRALARVPALALADGRMNRRAARASLHRLFGPQGTIALDRALWQLAKAHEHRRPHD